jgi:acyl-CoA thioesterase-1
MRLSWRAKVSSFVAVLAIVLGAAASGAAAATRPTMTKRVTVGAVTGPRVVAIGDSIIEGHGLDPSQAWPAMLAQDYGWRLTNLASDGSGFVTVGDNGDTFADQVAVAVRLHPAIVIVSGSSNDLGQPDATIARNTDATIRSIHAALPHAEILAVSPVWNDTAEPAQLLTIGEDVVNATRAVGGRELDIGSPLFGQPELMQSDDVHPSVAGQQSIASTVEAALSSTLRPIWV